MTEAAVEGVPGLAHPIPRGQAWFTLWSLVAILLFAYVDRQVFSLVAAPMAASLRLSNSQLGLIQGLGAAAFTLVATYPVAWLADRFDRRWVMAGCMITWALGTAACGLAQGFTSLFLGVVAVTASEAGAAPLILAVVPELFDGRERVTANLIYYLFAILSVALGMMFGGAAIGGIDSIHGALPGILRGLESWRLAFLIVAIPLPLFLALTAFMRLSRSPPRRGQPRPQAEPLLPHLRLHGRAIGLVISGIAFFGLAFSGLLVWMPISMTRVFGVTPAQNGVYTGVTCVISTLAGVGVASALMRWLEPRLGQRAAVRICWVVMLVAIPPVILMPLVTSALQAFILLGIQFGIGCLGGSLIPNILQALAPSAIRARILGIYTIVYTVVGAVGISGSAAVADMISGPRSMLWGVMIFSLPAWIICSGLFFLAERPFARTAEEVARL